MCDESTHACGNTHRSAGTPAARAASTEHRISAAAWSTTHWLTCHLLYGEAMARLPGPGSRSSAAVRGAANAAVGLVVATALYAAQSSAMSSSWESNGWPSA